MSCVVCGCPLFERTHGGGSPQLYCSASCARRSRRDKDRVRLRQYRAAHPEETLAYAKATRKRNREKVRARHVLAYALRTGAVVGGACERKGADCGGRIEAHHEDYSRPLDVRWACVVHHAELERESRQPNPPTPVAP